MRHVESSDRPRSRAKASSDHAQNGDSLRDKVLLHRVHHFGTKTRLDRMKKKGNQRGQNSAQTVDQQADLVRFLQFARSAE
jgi:hypothetical protein